MHVLVMIIAAGVLLYSMSNNHDQSIREFTELEDEVRSLREDVKEIKILVKEINGRVDRHDVDIGVLQQKVTYVEDMLIYPSGNSWEQQE